MLCIIQADQIHQLGEQIGTKMARAEEIGAEGLVDESLKLMEEIEEIKKKKAQLEVSLKLTMKTMLSGYVVYDSDCWCIIISWSW